MTEDFLILLLVLTAAYLFLSPFVLIILYSKQRKTIRWMEDEVRELRDSVHKLRQAAVREMAEAKQKPEPQPVQKEELPPTPTPAAQPVELEKAAPIPMSTPPPVKKVEAPAHVRVDDDVLQTSARIETGTKPRDAVVREFLLGIGMWPPKAVEGGDRETVLMQWWLPRIGGVLALLSALFFGVYINQSTSPVFKCLELVCVSLGITSLGWFMERRYKKFGGVLFVTGLVMLYLSSVAAYALPATRVIESPLIGSLVQGLILAGICALGLLRRSVGLVLLTFHFGYFLGAFMAFEGLREGALIEAGLLFIAGIALARKDLFRQLVWVIVPGSFLVVLVFPLLAIFRPVDIPASLSAQFFINFVFAGTTAAYFFGMFGKARPSRILLSVGSSLAILAAFWFSREFYPDDLQWASLALGLVMLAGSLAGWSSRGCGFLAQLLFIKATFLIGAWAILHYAGDLRWMIMALQTVVVAAAARRARVLSMELAVWAVLLVSLVFFDDALYANPIQGTFVWWMMVLYPAVITLAMAFLVKPLQSGNFSLKKFSREWVYAAIPFLAVLLWNVLFERTQQRGFDLALPFICIVYVATGLSFIPMISRWMLLQTAALAFIFGSIYFCNEPFSIIQLSGLVIAGIGALYFLLRRSDKVSILAESVLYVLIIVPITLWLLQIMDDWVGQSTVVFVLCGSIVFGGLIPRVRQIGSWSFLPLLVFMFTEQPASGVGVWGILALAAGLAWLVVPVLLPQVRKGQGWAEEGNGWSIICAILFWFYVLIFGDPEATWMTGQWVFGILGLILLWGAFRWKVNGYMIGAWFFVSAAAIRHYMAMEGLIGSALWKSEVLLSASLLFAFALVWFFLKPNPFNFKDEKKNQSFISVSSGLAALLIFLTSVVTFYYKDLGWTDWYTPILAITAFVIILLGLFRRDTVFRRMGLLALVIPLVRLFIVDVQDVLHRILAFAAAAILLTLLGYLYNRLASSLAEED